jgi:hypothetical protein
LGDLRRLDLLLRLGDLRRLDLLLRLGDLRRLDLLDFNLHLFVKGLRT